MFGLMTLGASKEKPALWGHFPVPSLMLITQGTLADSEMKHNQPAPTVHIVRVLKLLYLYIIIYRIWSFLVVVAAKYVTIFCSTLFLFNCKRREYQKNVSIIIHVW